MPSSSAARITSVPLGTVISKPSMVTDTPSVTGATAVSLAWRVIGSVALPDQAVGGGWVERAAAALLVLECTRPGST